MALQDVTQTSVIVDSGRGEARQLAVRPPGDSVRDAIVLSGWSWETFNVPERIALALSMLGMRVLYCDNPASMFRAKSLDPVEVEAGIVRYRPTFMGHRLNVLPLMPSLQSKMLARQILRQAEKLRLKDPIVVYPYYGELLPVCAELKSAGLELAFVCADFPSSDHNEHVRIADKVLVIPKAGYHRLKAQLGDKVSWIPQSCRLPGQHLTSLAGADELPDLAGIPHPRLGYLGVAQTRVNLALLDTFLKEHPDWHFVSFDERMCADLPNAHVLAWRNERELSPLIAALDVGFMPYKCTDDMNLHCVPLKLFDYFAAGLPVVATPIVYLWDQQDVVYLGDTARELARGVERALSEPVASPKKQKRIEIAREHSIERLSECLASILYPDSGRLASGVTQ